MKFELRVLHTVCILSVWIFVFFFFLFFAQSSRYQFPSWNLCLVHNKIQVISIIFKDVLKNQSIRKNKKKKQKNGRTNNLEAIAFLFILQTTSIVDQKIENIKKKKCVGVCSPSLNCTNMKSGWASISKWYSIEWIWMFQYGPNTVFVCVCLCTEFFSALLLCKTRTQVFS